MTEALDNGPALGTTARGLARSGGVLAVATALANVLGYALSVVLSRALGPGRFGAVAALLALSLIGAIPALGLQLTVAREGAVPPKARAAWIRTAVVVGLGLLVAFALAAPVARDYLDLDSAWAVVWVGVAMVPTTVSGALQGWLLGGQRYGRLGASLLVMAAARFVGGAAAALSGAGITGVLAATAVGTALACLVIAAIVLRTVAVADSEHAPPVWRARVVALSAAVSTTAAILVLTNVDVVLARHYLDPVDSGQYGIASLFARAAFWAPSFLALLVFPVLAHGPRPRSSFVVTVAATAGIGVGVVVGAAALGRLVIRATAGTAYTEAAWLAPWFALLGTACALLQLLLYAGLARRTRRIEAVVWCGIAVEVVLVSLFWHGSAAQIVATAILTCLAVAAVVALVERRTAASAGAA